MQHCSRRGSLWHFLAFRQANEVWIAPVHGPAFTALVLQGCDLLREHAVVLLGTCRGQGRAAWCTRGWPEGCQLLRVMKAAQGGYDQRHCNSVLASCDRWARGLSEIR